MSTETVTKKRSGRLREFVAYCIAGALAIGGVAGTSAVWNDSHTSDPTTIKFGTFDLSPTGYRAFSNGQSIDPATHKAAPGDTILLEYDYRVESDATNVIDLAADYVPILSYAGGGDMAQILSWITVNVSGDTVVKQAKEDAPYKVTLVDGQTTFTASATIAIPEELDTAWIGTAATYEGTMYVSQGDTVNADKGAHEVAAADVTVAPRGAVTWSGLVEGERAHLSEQSDGTVQIVQIKPAPEPYVEFFTTGTIDSLIADGYFTAIG